MKVVLLSPYPSFQLLQQLQCTQVSYENNATWTVTLARHLARLPDTEVHVITESSIIPASRQIVADNTTLHFVKVPDRFKTLTLWQLDRHSLQHVIQEIKPDIVHGQGIENQYGYVAITSQYPHLLTIHGLASLSRLATGGPGFSRASIVAFFEQLCIRRARNLVVINPFIAEYLRLDPHRYRLFPIPNPVDEFFFEPAAQPREPDLLLATGWVERLKGHDVLLAALALLQRRGLRLRTVIAGSVPSSKYFDQLQQFVRTERLAVEFTNFLPPHAVAGWMRRCTMLVHPSRHDNSPMSICEALAGGTPVVAARVGGVPRLIQDGRTGLLFESENTAALADKIQYLIENPAARARLGDNGRRYARETHAPERIARLTRDAYAAILGAPQTTRTNGRR
jgi:glycosyltransferase involved in cell wall biosynthesis